MKVLLLLLTIAAGSVATVLNLQHFASMKNQFAGVLPKSLSQVTAGTSSLQPPQVAGDRNIYAANVDGADIDPTAPATSADSTDDVLRQYGEPEHKERVSDGTYVWYYPYYIVYVGRRIVIHHRAINARAATAQANVSPSQRHWQGGSASTEATMLNRSGTGPATTSAGWRASNNSLGSTSLNSAGPRPATVGGSWQGSGAPAAGTAPVAPRVVAHVVRTSGATYRSGSVSTGASSGGQWAH